MRVSRARCARSAAAARPAMDLVRPAATVGIAEQLASRPGLPVAALMGSEIDARKLVSSLTLFERVGRDLEGTEVSERARALADTSHRLLATAAAEGYPPCAYTIARLERGATPSPS